VAVINLSITFLKVSDFKEQTTGFVSGYVNITVSSTIQINVTNNTVNFGAGGVNGTCNRAMLYTRGPGSNPIVICGNWSTSEPAHGIIIENNGNINATLTATGGDDADGFIGGTNPGYEWNVTMSESGSCSGNTFALNTWVTANTTAKTICTDFSPTDAGDEITIDINLTIPNDASIGALSDTISIVATVQS